MFKGLIISLIIKTYCKNRKVILMLENIRTFLAGKKTYLVALSAILGVVISWINGSVENAEAIKLIVDALLAMTIRAGVSKTK
jgi:hypothetical protein